MTLRTWAMFAVTELLLCFSPGPAVLFVIGSALRHGAPASLRSNLGILSGNALYFALSAAGLGALLTASYTLFTALKWLGAAYLLWLGVQLLLPPIRLRGVPAEPVQRPGIPLREQDPVAQAAEDTRVVPLGQERTQRDAGPALVDLAETEAEVAGPLGAAGLQGLQLRAVPGQALLGRRQALLHLLELRLLERALGARRCSSAWRIASKR